MTTWPATLPLPTIQGYDIRPGEAILRTEMESGPARQRKRFTQVPSRFTARWLMRRTQFAVFESWYSLQAQDGGTWFDINLLNGIGLSTSEARFTRQFDARLTGGGMLWEVTTELEIRERPVLSAEALAIGLDSDIDALIVSTNNLHTLVHIKLPSPYSW